MKKFSSKALLGALSTIGTIAAFGITAGTAHATGAVAAATVNIPQELVSGTIQSIINTTNPITYTTTAASNSGGVTVNISGGSLSSGTYSLQGSTTLCSASIGSGTSASTLSLTNCTLSNATSYTLEYAAPASTSFNPSLSFVSVSNASLVVSMSSAVGVGSATLFNAIPELSFSIPSSSTYTIDTSQTLFSNSSNSASNSISMTDNYNTVSWLSGGYIKKGNINFVFSNIPSSVTSVSASVNNNNINFAGSSTTSTTNIVTNSTTIGASISSASNPGSATYSFTFSNSGNIATGTIDVAVNGSSLTSTTVQTSTGGSYTWLNNTPFVTFTNLTANIYGELVYLTPAAMQTFYEELRLVLPSNISASSVLISVAGNSCSNLSQYVLSSVSRNNQITYNVNISNLLSASCVGNSYNVGDLVPIQISLPATADISQVSGVAFVAGAGQSKRLPLNVVQGQATHLTY